MQKNLKCARFTLAELLNVSASCVQEEATGQEFKSQASPPRGDWSLTFFDSDSTPTSKRFILLQVLEKMLNSNSCLTLVEKM